MLRRSWLLVLLLLPTLAATRARVPPTQEIFERYSKRVVQVRILDRSTESKSVIGSGFFVGPNEVVTNFHVVSPLVHHPDRYRAELVLDGGASSAVEVVHLDVVHDLAVVRTGTPTNDYFTFADDLPAKGTRLYAFGNPHDLGSSIVEGTFNGLLDESLYEKIHFTGAINPGMSGGPTTTYDGRVVGINVATAGDEVSFLVPASYAARLVAVVTAPGFQPPDPLIDLVRDQLQSNQDSYIGQLLAKPFDPVSLGPYQLPGKLASYFKCWGDTQNSTPQRPYDLIQYDCSLEDSIFIDDTWESGTITLQHRLLRSSTLNRFQFATLYQAAYQATLGELRRSDDFTRYVCKSDYIEHAGVTWKVAFCVRAYKKLTGLYDAVVKAASLNDNTAGVQTTLDLRGVTFENAQRFAQHYMEALTWTAP